MSSGHCWSPYDNTLNCSARRTGRTESSTSHLLQAFASSAQPSLDANSKLEDVIKAAQTHYGNIMEFKGSIVAIRCHICKANAAMTRLHRGEENPYLDLKGLGIQYNKCHKEHDEVRDRDWAKEDTMIMCEKYSISNAELGQIARGGKSRTDFFRAKSYDASISKSSKLRLHAPHIIQNFANTP